MPATTHYLLDSNVCIAVLRKAPNLRRLPPPGRCLISQITVAELWTGVEKGNLRDERAVKLDELLASFTLSISTMPPPAPTAKSARRWKSKVRLSAPSTCSSPPTPEALAQPS